MTKPEESCERARRFIIDGARSAAEERELRQHLDACEPCACLAADGGALARELGLRERDPELGGVLAELERSLEAERGITGRARSLPTPARLLLALGGAAMVILVGGLLRPRVDLDAYPALRLGVGVGALGATAALGVWLWLRPLFRSPLPAWAVPALAMTSVGLPWLIAGAPMAHQAHPASLAGAGDDLAVRAVACLLYGGLWGGAVLVLVRLLGRAPGARTSFEALAGLSGALIGSIVLELHCPITQPAHLLLGHAPLAVLLAALLIGASSLVRAARSPHRR